MIAFLVAWAMCMVAACFVITAVSVAIEVRDHRASKAGRLVGNQPAPRIPEQRTASSAAAVVQLRDAQAFDEFLRELIVTTHVEDVLR